MNKSFNDNSDVVLKHPICIEILISAFVWGVSFLTIAGNVLVLEFFARDAQLQSKPGNLFLLSLALADLIVGLISLTFNNLWRYYGNWPFGKQL